MVAAMKVVSSWLIGCFEKSPIDSIIKARNISGFVNWVMFCTHLM